MRSRTAMIAAAAATVLSAPAFADSNLVTNGGFEDNYGAGEFNQPTPASAGGQNSSTPGTTATGWTVIGTDPVSSTGYAYIFSNTNSFTTANGNVGPASEYGNPEGSNTLPLWGNSSDGSPEGNYFYGVDSTFHPSALQQELSGLVVGQTYTITFDYAAAQQFGYNGNSTDQWIVTLGGQTIATTPVIDLASNTFSGWQVLTPVTFTYEGAGQNPNLLSLVNIGQGGCDANFLNCAGNDPGASGAPPFSLIDGVNIKPVPEASTWVMMLAGFAGLSFAGFRNRRRTPISIV